MAITHKATLLRIKQMLEVRGRLTDGGYCPWTKDKLYPWDNSIIKPRHCKSCATVMESIEYFFSGNNYRCPCCYYNDRDLNAFEIAKRKVKEAEL